MTTLPPPTPTASASVSATNRTMIASDRQQGGQPTETFNFSIGQCATLANRAESVGQWKCAMPTRAGALQWPSPASRPRPVGSARRVDTQAPRASQLQVREMYHAFVAGNRLVEIRWMRSTVRCSSA